MFLFRQENHSKTLLKNRTQVLFLEVYTYMAGVSRNTNELQKNTCRVVELIAFAGRANGLADGLAGVPE
jgi:hypothetical protein